MLLREINPQRHPELELQAMNDGVVVHHLITERVHVLNGSAALILTLCDGHHSVDQLVNALVGESGISFAKAQSDVRRFLLELVELDLIEYTP